MIKRRLRELTVLVGAFMLASCIMADLPPVPPPTPYQPAHTVTAVGNQAERLVIAIPENRPPYYDGVHDNGIERDIIREAFLLVGRHSRFMAAANRQEKYDAKSSDVDCVTTISDDFQLKSETYFSDPVISYHYTPFVLQSSGIVIKKYSDLAGKTVEAFSFASRYMGPEFTDMIAKMSNYSEHANRTSQVAMLLTGHVDVLIMDRVMFHFVRRSLINDRPGYYDAKVVEIPAEEVVSFDMACHKKKIINEFNMGLAMLRSGHRYEAIFKHYLTD